MKKISRKEAVELIYAQKNEGVFFGVSFIKRTTGELRKMVCRGGVQKHLKGGELSYNPSDHALIGIWDSTVEDRTKAYRMIAIEGIKTLSAGGEEYEVVD